MKLYCFRKRESKKSNNLTRLRLHTYIYKIHIHIKFGHLARIAEKFVACNCDLPTMQFFILVLHVKLL